MNENTAVEDHILRKGKCTAIFATLGFFVACYSASGLMTSTLSMYINSQISTLERQFGLSSTESGMLLSANDIGFLTLTLFTGYIARRVHIPKILAFSTILYGVSGLLCVIPYILTRINEPETDTYNLLNQYLKTNATEEKATKHDAVLLCLNRNVSMYNDARCSTSSGIGTTLVPNEYPSLRKATMAIICIGMVFQGLAKAPRSPFVSQYVDENGPKQKTGWYLGIITTVAFFGPLLAYGLGGLFSRNYVTLEDVKLSPRDPRWIGAWWLGFLVFGAVSIIVSIPMFLIPRGIQYDKEENKKTKAQSKGKQTVLELKEMLKALWRIVKNPLYSILMLSSIVQLLGVTSYFSFVAKYMEYQFSIPVWHASYILAICMISAMCIGTFLGGALTRKIGNSPRKLIGSILLLALGSTIVFSAGFFIGCDSTTISGPNIDGYKDTMSSCLRDCDCNAENYFPACGADGVTYFSPCYAGCSATTGTTFRNCTCVDAKDQTVTAGSCETDCPYLYPFAVSNFLCSMISAAKIMPSLVTKMRVVGDRDKALAVSVASFTMSIFGWLPGPLLIGSLIDSSCSLWKNDCGTRGACALYDLNRFRLNVHAFPMVARVIVVLLLGIAYFKVRNMTSWEDKQEEKPVPEKEEIITYSPK